MNVYTIHVYYVISIQMKVHDMSPPVHPTDSLRVDVVIPYEQRFYLKAPAPVQRHVETIHFIITLLIYFNTYFYLYFYLFFTYFYFISFILCFQVSQLQLFQLQVRFVNALFNALKTVISDHRNVGFQYIKATGVSNYIYSIIMTTSYDLLFTTYHLLKCVYKL